MIVTAWVGTGFEEPSQNTGCSQLTEVKYSLEQAWPIWALAQPSAMMIPP